MIYTTNKNTTFTVNGVAKTSPYYMTVSANVTVEGSDSTARSITLTGCSADQITIKKNNVVIQAGTNVVNDGDTVSLTLSNTHSTMTVNGTTQTSPYSCIVSEDIAIVVTMPTARDLTISGDGGAIVKRNGDPISAGTGVLYDYDEITIYSSVTHSTTTVNGTTVTTPYTMTVSSNVAVVSTAPEKRDLTITGTGATGITCTFNGESVTAGTDVLTDYGTFNVVWTNSHYTVTLNGTEITSPYSCTVSEDIAIVATAPTLRSISVTGTAANSVTLKRNGSTISAGTDVIADYDTFGITWTASHLTVTVDGTEVTSGYVKTVEGDITVVANEPSYRSVTVVGGGKNYITLLRNGQEITAGTDVIQDYDTLGVQFNNDAVSVTVNGTSVSSLYTMTVNGSNIQVIAQVKSYTLTSSGTYSSVPTFSLNGTTISAPYTIYYDDTLTVTCDISSYDCTVTQGGHSVKMTTSPYSVTVTGNVSVATEEKQTTYYHVVPSAGSVYDEDSVEIGTGYNTVETDQSVSWRASSSSDFYIDGVLYEGVTTSTDIPLTVNENHHICEKRDATATSYISGSALSSCTIKGLDGVTYGVGSSNAFPVTTAVKIENMTEGTLYLYSYVPVTPNHIFFRTGGGNIGTVSTSASTATLTGLLSGQVITNQSTSETVEEGDSLAFTTPYVSNVPFWLPNDEDYCRVKANETFYILKTGSQSFAQTPTHTIDFICSVNNVFVQHESQSAKRYIYQCHSGGVLGLSQNAAITVYNFSGQTVSCTVEGTQRSEAYSYTFDIPMTYQGMVLNRVNKGASGTTTQTFDATIIDTITIS